MSRSATRDRERLCLSQTECSDSDKHTSPLVCMTFVDMILSGTEGCNPGIYFQNKINKADNLNKGVLMFIFSF